MEGGFTVDDFTVDEQQGTVTCPAGHTVALSRTRIATFGVLCRDCPLRARCTTCKTGRKLVLHERDDLLRAARADWAASSGLREDYMTHRPERRTRHRPGRHLAGTPAQAPLPRDGQEQRLAQAPHRRAQPAQPDRQGPGPPRRRLGAGHLTRRPGPPGMPLQPIRPAGWPWPGHRRLCGARPQRERADHRRCQERGPGCAESQELAFSAGS